MSGLSLRNTLSRRVDAVPVPADGPVRMYTCGPTVYRWAHIGNLRSYLLADFIRRTLLYHGVPVLHVKNITDVGHLRDERFDRGEDRMLVAAGLESKTPAEIADAYEAGFHEDEALVNILPAHVFPRATEHVPDMLELAVRLESLGHAYLSEERNLYYAVSSFADYGRLSGNTLDLLRAGHRGDVEPDKRDSADFALWKAAGEGRILRWPSPWGDGFPGWHLECSAMAMRYLGPDFEIHTGGIDNVFPHHEDEIAQSTPITGGPPVRLWVHGEHLLAAGRKMAKSTGNFERVTELRDQGIDPLAFRYLALTVRYGRKLNYSADSITAAGAALASLRGHLAALGPPPADGPWAAPVPLRAGSAGPRPIGIASGVAGHQGRADAAAPTAAEPLLVDRAALAGRPSPVPRRAGAPRAVRGGDRRRPGPAHGARRDPRDAPGRPARRRAPVARARRRPGARPRPRPGVGVRRRRPPRRRGGAARRPGGGTRGARLGAGRRAPRRARGDGRRGDRRARRDDHPPPGPLTPRLTRDRGAGPAASRTA